MNFIKNETLFLDFKDQQTKHIPGNIFTDCLERILGKFVYDFRNHGVYVSRNKPRYV